MQEKRKEFIESDSEVYAKTDVREAVAAAIWLESRACALALRYGGILPK